MTSVAPRPGVDVVATGVMGAGHLLAADRSNRAARALGASSEEAA